MGRLAAVILNFELLEKYVISLRSISPEELLSSKPR
jgi:hypothetical protein